METDTAAGVGRRTYRHGKLTTTAAATGPAAATTTAEASSFNAFHDFAAAAGFGDGDGGYDDYDDDPDLLLAIQESLRK